MRSADLAVARTSFIVCVATFIVLVLTICLADLSMGKMLICLALALALLSVISGRRLDLHLKASRQGGECEIHL
jgi:hypothetical protein